MALVVSSLISDLEDLFSDPPSTFEGCASAWASSMSNYSALFDSTPLGTSCFCSSCYGSRTDFRIRLGCGSR